MVDSTRCFDADAPSTWRDPYTGMLQRLGLYAAIPALLQDADLNSRERRWVALSKLRPGDSIRDEAEKTWRDAFSRAYLYHACRIADARSYLDHGLRPTRISDLDDLAFSLFRDSPELRLAIEELRVSGYANHNDGKVFFFFARSGAVHVGEGYHSAGSEYLRALANRVGPAAQRILIDNGRPAVVRAKIEVDALSASDVRYASLLPLYHLLTAREHDLPERIVALEGGTYIAGPIRPDAITIEFLN